MRAIPVLLCLTAMTLSAQRPPENESIRQGIQLDLQGKHADARAAFQKAIDTAPESAAKANAQRAIAMSWAFEGNCKKTTEYEEMVIDYWKTQEQTAPDRAFYQQGEMADEAARVCIDHGDLSAAQELYKRGHDLGMKEPGISPARKDLWDYRWEHAQARVAARRGNKAEAEKHIAAAKAILDNMKQKDDKLYEQQASFLPYLTGYVAYYTGDYQTALEDLQKANQRDGFILCLLGMTLEKLGDKTRAMETYRKAASINGHNPPAAFARPFAARKLGEG
ncbi:MAG TPA: tetratricopeptide repeat protein [Bryobacteraceae bacterium]